MTSRHRLSATGRRDYSEGRRLDCMPPMTALAQLITHPGFKTFRELDQLHGRAKGDAFRAFKALGAQLREGQDFHCCDRRVDGEEFDLLAASGRLYPGTVNGVLLAPSAQTAIAARFAAGDHSPSA